MGIPTEVVGSLPRPEALQKAYAAYDAGEITREEFIKIQDQAVEDSLLRVAATGETYTTDGESRKSSFATYPITETLAGTGIAEGLGGGGLKLAVFDDGHDRQLPRLTAGPFKYKNYSHDYFRQSQPLARGYPMKTAVISPSMIYLLYPLDPSESIPDYPRAQFAEDVVNECEKDIRGCFSAGAKRVSIDFTEGRLTLKNDPRTPWTQSGLLPEFIDLLNRVLDRFAPEERRNIGLHTCPGGDQDSPHSAEVPYNLLLPSLLKVNAGYFLIQLSSEKDRRAIYKEIASHLRMETEDGVKQVVFIGVTDPIDPRVETPEEIAEKLVEAAEFIPKDQLGATDDCGFSPFCLDGKPKHGDGEGKGPDWAREVALKKIRNRVEGARIASEKLGI